MHPLEKRQEMNGTFPGRIVLVEGDEVDVDLQIAADKVRLATPFAEIGLWDRNTIHFERNSSGGYELSVADDVVTFYPADLAAFSQAVEGDHESEVPDRPLPSPEPPVSLVPAMDDDRVGFDEEPPTEDEQPQTDIEEDPVAKFGPSSRERLAAAMTGFRKRQESEENEGDPDVSAEERTSSPGFVIPGDAGYEYPGETDHASIHFDEEVENSTVADDIIATQRSLRSARTLDFNPALLKKIGIGAVVLAVLVGLGFAVPVVLDFFSGGDEATQTTVVATTVPVTEVTPTTIESTTEPTVAEEPVEPVDSSVFQLTPDAFVERWNDTASQVSPSLRLRSSLPAGDFEVGFTQYIAMIGSSGSTPSGLSALTLEIDPTGPSSSDQLGIQALGLAIAVADPTLEPSERGAVLGAMGLNVRDPDLEGLDGSFSRNGVDYRLVFDSEDLILRLTISAA